MEPTEFRKWLAQIDELTPSQRQRSLDALTAPDPARASHDVIEERLADERTCPRCSMPGATLHGMANALQRYRCNHCGRTFNALTGTNLAGLRKKEKWLDFSEALKAGETLEKSAERCGVHPSTTFRWRHRFLKSFAADKATELMGIAEADETFSWNPLKARKICQDQPENAVERHRSLVFLLNRYLF